MSKLIEQLETLPSFLNLKSSILENLKSDNFYVAEFMPKSEVAYDDKDDNGKQGITTYFLSDYKREQQAINDLLDDNKGYFDEFVHDDEIRRDVTEFIRDLIKEILKQGDIR